MILFFLFVMGLIGCTFVGLGVLPLWAAIVVVPLFSIPCAYMSVPVKRKDGRGIDN